MTTLHDRLADLAETVDATPNGPTDLWRRGRRYGRRRAAGAVGTVLAVALVAAVGTAGLAARSTQPVEPAAPQGRTVLPDRFFVPSGRLPVAYRGTGPLVAVIPTEHFAWLWNGERGLVGVSAVDQKYAFLNLPGWIGDVGVDESWSLAANGRWVAYWYGDREPGETEFPADGIAVLDTATGEVRRHELKSELGVQPHKTGVDGNTLWFTQWDYLAIDEEGGGPGRLASSFAWNLDDDHGPHQVADPRRLLMTPMGTALENGFLTMARGGRWFVVSGEGDLTSERVARVQAGTQGAASGPAALSPDGHTIAMTEIANSGSQARILTGTVAGDDTQVDYVRADMGSYPYLLGWLDNHSLVVEATRASERLLVAVEVETGRQRILATFEQRNHDTAQYAIDLLRSPVVDAVPPPDPLDPRKAAALVGLGVLTMLWLARYFHIRRRRGRRLDQGARVRRVRRGAAGRPAADGVPPHRHHAGRRGPRPDRAGQGGAALASGSRTTRSRTSVRCWSARASRAGGAGGGARRPPTRCRRRWPSETMTGRGAVRDALRRWRRASGRSLVLRYYEDLTEARDRRTLGIPPAR